MSKSMNKLTIHNRDTEKNLLGIDGAISFLSTLCLDFSPLSFRTLKLRLSNTTEMAQVSQFTRVDAHLWFGAAPYPLPLQDTER